MSSGEALHNRLFRNKQTEHFLNLNRKIGIPYPQQEHSSSPDELDPKLRNFLVQDIISHGKKDTRQNISSKTAVTEDSSFINTLLEKITKLEGDISKTKEEYDNDRNSWQRKYTDLKNRTKELEHREAKMKTIILDMAETFSTNQLYNKWHFDIQVCRF